MTLAPPPAHLVDPGAAQAIFAAADLDVVAAQPDYVRHKPGETTIVSYLFTTGSGRIERGYVHWCADPARADEIDRKARTLRLTANPIGSATRRLDRHTILYPFPNDARLRRLRWYTTPRKLKRTLGSLAPGDSPLSGSKTTVDVLRYKPERRVVVAADLTTTAGDQRRVLVRHATARQARMLANAARSLRRAGVHTPEPLLQLDDDRTSVDEFIDGRELRAATRDRAADPAAVADAIADFHATPADAPIRTAIDDLGAACDGLAGLATWHDDVGEAAEAVRRELARTVPTDDAEHTLLHGDLHDKNVMITPTDHVAFVDLERIARGPAAIDLGRLRGIVTGMTIRQPGSSPHALGDIDDLVEHYRRRQPLRITDARLAWHTAVALVDQALLVARHLEPNWRCDTRTLLDLALAEITPIRTS